MKLNLPVYVKASDPVSRDDIKGGLKVAGVLVKPWQESIREQVKHAAGDKRPSSVWTTLEACPLPQLTPPTKLRKRSSARPKVFRGRNDISSHSADIKRKQSIITRSTSLQHSPQPPLQVVPSMSMVNAESFITTREDFCATIETGTDVAIETDADVAIGTATAIATEPSLQFLNVADEEIDIPSLFTSNQPHDDITATSSNNEVSTECTYGHSQTNEAPLPFPLPAASIAHEHDDRFDARTFAIKNMYPREE